MSRSSGSPAVGCDVVSFSISRLGMAPHENEDAVAGPVQRRDGLFAAVADGATESADAGLWARTLAGHFVSRFEPEGDHEAWVEVCRRVFRLALAEPPPSAPWYVQQKRRQGAFAAFAGIVVSEDQTWSGYAVGDCCIMRLDGGGRIIRSWPMSSPDEFHHRPALVGSADGRSGWTAVQQRWQRGESIILATDAVAAWILARSIEGALLSVHQIQEMLISARESDEIRNDDHTVLVLADLR